MIGIVWIGIAIVAFLIVLFLVLFKLAPSEKPTRVPPEKRAGQRGEMAFFKKIKPILRNDDVLLRNIVINYDGRTTELDNVIVNQYGVFIIEVKNLKGKLRGKESDYQWTRTKVTDHGNVYISDIRNPINQLKRQIDILSKYFKANGIKVWIDGYVFLLRGNSPCKSDNIIKDIKGIDSAIHTKGKNKLSKKTINRICKAL